MIYNGNNKDSMDLKKELWDKLTQMEEKKQGKADTYYDILALFNVVGQSEQCEKPNFYPVGKSQTSYYCTKCGKQPNEH